MTTRSRAPSRVLVLGIPVDLLTRSAVDAWLLSVVTGTEEPGCRHLVTLNPEYVIAAMRDAGFRNALRNADLATPDGIGIILAVRWLYPEYPARGAFDRVTGVDITEMIAGISAVHGVPVYLLGAGSGIAEIAARKLSGQYPGFVLAGTWDGGMPTPLYDVETLSRIGACDAKVLLVAYGAPGQIHWIARNQAALAGAGVRLVIGVGGTFDFISGTVPRAPRWMQRMGFEWLYRLLREPWRWRRQLVLLGFAWRVTVEGVRLRLRSRAPHGS